MINSAVIPFLRSAVSRERARAAPGMLMHFLATSADTNGAFAMLEARGRQGMEPRAHMLLTCPACGGARLVQVTAFNRALSLAPDVLDLRLHKSLAFGVSYRVDKRLERRSTFWTFEDEGWILPG